MTGTNCDLFTHNQSQSYLNHLVVTACSTYGKEERYAVFWLENLKEEDHMKDPGVDGTIILKWTIEKWNGGMDWIDMVQDRSRWRTLVNAVMNLQVP